MTGSELLPLVLVALGWFVIHGLSVKRDKLNSLRSFCIETRHLVENIERVACQYHSSPERPVTQESILKTDLNKLDARLNWLSIKMDLPSSYIIEFRQAVTASNFETIDFKRQHTSERLIQNIFLCSTRICEKLYEYELS